MNRLLAMFLTSMLLMVACQGNKNEKMTEQAPADSTDSLATSAAAMEAVLEANPLPKAADELFDDFFFNFIDNRKLQRERIRFPLPVEKGKQTELLESGQWKTDRFFVNQGYYTLIFDNRKQMELMKDTAVAHVVVEKIFLDQKWVKQYVFEREQGLWMLTAIRHKHFSETANASFLAFYSRFATDTVFQIQSLHDPVTFTGPDPDDDFKQIEGVITPDTWLAFSPEMPAGMIYNIIYGKDYVESRRKIFLIRGIANGLEIEMEFSRQAGNWKLTTLNT
ncbi:MAG: DUF4348 domain-containing protein [Prevotella sp.]